MPVVGSVGDLLELALIARVERLLDEVAEDRVAALIDELRGDALQLLEFRVGERGLVLATAWVGSWA